MDIFFSDPNEIPLPPDEVRILDLKIKPYPDNRRIRLIVQLTPFQKKPSGDIFIKNQAGDLVASTSFIEAVTPKFEMTLHLRKGVPGNYNLVLSLFYSRDFEEDPSDGSLLRPENTVVDEQEIAFTLEN